MINTHHDAQWEVPSMESQAEIRSAETWTSK
jgi:hypothetical protein